MSGVSSDFPFRISTCLHDWSVGRQSAAVYSPARLSVCRVVLEIPRARHERFGTYKSPASS